MPRFFLLLIVLIAAPGCASTPAELHFVGCYELSMVPPRLMIRNDQQTVYFKVPRTIELTPDPSPHYTAESGFKIAKPSAEESMDVKESIWRIEDSRVSRIGDDFWGIGALLEPTSTGLGGPAEPFIDTGPNEIFGGQLTARRIDCHGG